MTIINYQLANTSGYKFNIAKVGEYNYDDLALYHKDNFPDLEITRPNTSTDLSLLDTKALLSVNGYIYPSTFIDNKLFIPKATHSMLKTRHNAIGILSFNKLEQPLKKTPITAQMISQESPIPMFEKVIITFDHDVGHPILVIAGYLIFEQPEFFYRVSSRSFVLRLDRLQYVEKLYELNRYRNIFSELGVPTSINNPYLIDGDVVRSDMTITKVLTLHNSFLVEVPCNGLERTPIYLEHSNVPGNFRTEVEPRLPIFGGYGKIIEYRSMKHNDSKYTVYTNDAYYNNHLFSKLSAQQIKLYNDHRLPGTTYRLSEAFFMRIDAK